MTILRGIRVLAVGNSLENAGDALAGGRGGGHGYAGGQSQAGRFAGVGRCQRNIRLALRSPREPIRSAPTES